MEDYDLTVIIPVHNSRDTIRPLAETFLGIKPLRTQVILVDDASQDGTTEVVADLAAATSDLVSLRHETNAGAGVARNTGFYHAAGRYTLFFDDDDIVHPGAVVRAVSELDQGQQDLALLRYHYRRGLDESHQAMNSYDIDLWATQVGETRSATLRLVDAPKLLGLTNYPWNKVLRTATYRRAGLRFGATAVHNDILGHWWSLLFADRIVLLNEEICTHVVLAGGANLTNSDSLARLALFDALDETYDLLEANPTLRRLYSPEYWESVIRVSSWASDRTTPSVAPQFNARLQAHLMRIDLADFGRLRRRGASSVSRAIVRKALS